MCTYSRYLVHGAGSDMAMKQQLVNIVNIMNRLNNVRKKLRKVYCGTVIYSFTVKQDIMICQQCVTQ